MQSEERCKNGTVIWAGKRERMSKPYRTDTNLKTGAEQKAMTVGANHVISEDDYPILKTNLMLKTT